MGFVLAYERIAATWGRRMLVAACFNFIGGSLRLGPRSTRANECLECREWHRRFPICWRVGRPWESTGHHARGALKFYL